MSKEQAVRDAAQKLHDTIEAAAEDGLYTSWPNNHRDLPTIAVSEIGKAKVQVQVSGTEDVTAETVAKAAGAAQKAADRTVDKADAKS